MNGNGPGQSRSDPTEKQDTLKKSPTQNNSSVPQQPPQMHYPFVYGYPCMVPPPVMSPTMTPGFPAYIHPANYCYPWSQTGVPGAAAAPVSSTPTAAAPVLPIPTAVPPTSTASSTPIQPKETATPSLTPPIKQTATPPTKRPSLPSKGSTAAQRVPDLSNAEELAKWKAERRLKFPRLAATETETESGSSKAELGGSAPAKKETTEEDSVAVESKNSELESESEPESDREDEEGALLESPSEKGSNLTAGPARRRVCKYFARGQCRRGAACTFEHDTVSGMNTKTASGNTTLFERLVEQEDEKRLLRFFECIKAISAFN